MNLSIFTTVSDPGLRGDPSRQALNCYKKLADEVVVVDGSLHDKYPKANFENVRIVRSKWPREFAWPFIGQQFQRGFEACRGDWVIHADCDFIFHEKDFEAIRKACEQHNDSPALSLWKYLFILPDRYNLKSRLVIAVNKGKFGDRIRFDSGGDLAQPSLDGRYINPESVPEARVPFYCYEKILKTKEQIAEDSGRMERAYHRHFGEYQMGSDGTNESACQAWLKMTVGRFTSKPQASIELREHPIVMQGTIKNLKPENWGYSGHGLLTRNAYV